MKKSIGMLTLVFVLFASFALAQPQGQRPQGQVGFGGGAQGEIQRLLTEAGIADLGLSTDTVTKLREALRPAAPAGGGNQNATPEERRAAAEKAAEETAKKVADILSKDQLEKVQIRAFQLGGYAGLSGRYAQATLKVTDAQKTKIAEIARENRTAQGTGAGNAQMTPEERRARMEENRKALGEKFKEVLTADQKTKADELLKEIPAYIKEIQDRPAGIGAGGAGNRGGAAAPGAGGGNRGAGTGTGGNRGTGGTGGGGNRGNRGGGNN